MHRARSRGIKLDKAAIFKDLTQRNALRLANGLPALDLPGEYAHAVAVAQAGEFQAFCNEHAAERDAIRCEVLAEYRGRFGPGFGSTMGGRWAVGALTRKRFIEYLALKYGVTPDGIAPARNTVTYGEAL